MSFPHDRRPAVVYRMFSSSGELLYVGMSVSALTRLASHIYNTQWVKDVANVTLEWHGSVAEAETAERLAIMDEKPLHNVAYSAAIDPRKLPVGAAALSHWMRENKVSDDTLGPACGLSFSTISTARRGLRNPKPHTARKIGAQTNPIIGELLILQRTYPSTPSGVS